MTKTWGPLGWATLQSVAALYPDEPTELEQQLLIRWIDAFRRTIVCEKCHQHFTQLLNEYSALYPNWYASRKNFTLFVLRAHNTVNVRTSKSPISMEEAFRQLRKNIDPTKAHLQRQSYILYIRRDWGKQTTLGGATAARYIKEITMTETEYWSTREPFTWDEIEDLVRGSSNDPLPSKQSSRSTLFGDVLKRIGTATTTTTSSLPRPPTNPQTQIRISTSSKPRFSFVSR